jgi:hypothetical protein
LRLCINENKLHDNYLKNPFYRNYWSDLSYYHGNKANTLRRFWDDIPEISMDQWNPFMCVEYAYGDYEKRLLSGQITLGVNETTARHEISQLTFQQKIQKIIEPEKGHTFKLAIPVDVTMRIEDTLNSMPFRKPVIKVSRKIGRSKALSDPMEETSDKHRFTFIFIGDKKIVTEKISNYKHIESSKRKADAPNDASHKKHRPSSDL